MKIDTQDFRIRPGKQVKLNRLPTRVHPFYKSPKDYHAILEQHVTALSEQQQMLYASGRNALLLIFQGMDAAGKDGAIRHVMSGINPQGCEVASFKQPSVEELSHDFLWRTNRRLPERGRIGIFNRSYYEEVLVVRVHPECLKNEGLLADSGDPAKAIKPRKLEEIFTSRYRSIVDMEHHLHRNGVRILKFFLHLSKEEQRQRFLARIDDPAKNWKFSMADIHERKFWDQYTQAFEECLHATSTAHSPWYAVPADDKNNARLIISAIVLDALKSLKLSYPKTTPERHKELLAIRHELKG
ncbi:MAG: ADP-polyphosphate phosphotransferase [Acidobacteriaceae bacterium]